MSLETGTYIILSQLTKAPIGPTPERLPVVKVVGLPESVSPPFWKITKEGDGFYKIEEGGRSAVPIERLLFVANEGEVTWKIEEVPQQGKNAYIIVRENGEGWVADSEAFTQVAVRPLIIFPTYPPRYPLTEVFEILRVDRDD